MVQPTKALTMAVTRLINRKSETKYRAATIQDNGYVLGNLGGGDSWKYLFPVIPSLAQGDGSAQRVGNSISPLKLKVTVDYFFHRNGFTPLLGQSDDSVKLPGTYRVRQFSLTSKSIRGCSAWVDSTAAQKTAQQGRMLEVGDGSTATPNSAELANLDFKISDENWTKHKGNKTFLMGKQSGSQWTLTGDSIAPGQVYTKRVTFFVKCPKTFKYEDPDNGGGAGQSYPTNFNSLMGVYAGLVAPSQNASIFNSPYTSYDGLMGATSSTSPSYPFQPIIRYTVRSELWYKDL